MIKNNIKQLLIQQGKSIYWLEKQTGITYPTLFKLANNKSESIKFANLEKICNVIGCTLDELFTIENQQQ